MRKKLIAAIAVLSVILVAAVAFLIHLESNELTPPGSTDPTVTGGGETDPVPSTTDGTEEPTAPQEGETTDPTEEPTEPEGTGAPTEPQPSQEPVEPGEDMEIPIQDEDQAVPSVPQESENGDGDSEQDDNHEYETPEVGI